MASVVDTSVKHFTSDSAPMVLNGTAGSGLAVLKACLVTGYGLMTAVSLVVAGGVATATFASPHAARVLQVVDVTGVTGSLTALNGEQKVTARVGNTISWATAAPDGTATGTIAVKVAPAGWEELYTKTNVSVFRSLSPERHGQVLRVDDTAAQVMRVVGYESMSDVDTGVNPFPTEAQYAGGGRWWKSGVATAAAVTWAVFADHRAFFLWSPPYSYSGGNSTRSVVRGFGDAIALSPSGDVHATFIGYSNSGTASEEQGAQGSLSGGFVTVGAALARTMDGATLSQIQNTRSYIGNGVGGGAHYSGLDAVLGAASTLVDGRLLLSRKYFVSGSAPRCDLPGLLYVPHSATRLLAAPFDTIDGSAEFAGRVLMALHTASQNPVSGLASDFTAGLSFFDITGPWR